MLGANPLQHATSKPLFLSKRRRKLHSFFKQAQERLLQVFVVAKTTTQRDT
jgi:hypothetical protein